MAMDVLGQLGASLTGCIETAKLLIYDYRSVISASTNKINSSSLSAAGKAKALTGLQNKHLPDISSFRKQATNAENTGMSFDDPSKTKTFTVHFNPSKLQIYASTIPVPKPDAQGKENLNDSTTKARMTLTTTLFFDEMNVYDSFMVDKFTMGLSASGVTNIASSIAKNGMGKKWSVRDEVEGLIAALRNPYTRNVSFRWADFTFTGQLNTVNAQYTMFSTSGEPVRAQVQLRIQHEMDDVYLDKWYKEYDSAMMGDASSLTGAAQKVGNILNFNL